MIRYKVIVEYCGKNYSGMQRQSNQKTVQGCLEDAISKFLNTPIEIGYCGRTDAGVHAMGQVIHFDSHLYRDTYSVLRGINFYLQKESISILKAERVSPTFHSRFDAKKRWYLYKIINRDSVLTFQKDTHLHVRDMIDIEKMIEASKILIGMHDFSAFRSSSCQSQNVIKTIDKIEITKNDDQVHMIFVAKSFLHHMVRNIVGSLIEVGIGRRSSSWLSCVLNSGDRTIGAKTASPQGLYFLKVEY